MKPAKKPLVVEFKNRRRVPRKDASIWWPIDLRLASSELPGEPMIDGDSNALVHEGAEVEAEAEIIA